MSSLDIRYDLESLDAVPKIQMPLKSEPVSGSDRVGHGVTHTWWNTER